MVSSWPRGSLGAAVGEQRSENCWDILLVYGDHQGEYVKSETSLTSPSRASGPSQQSALPSSKPPGFHTHKRPGTCPGPQPCPSRPRVSQRLIRLLGPASVTLLKGRGEAGGCPGRSHRHDQSHGNQALGRKVKGLELCRLEEAGKSWKKPTPEMSHRDHVSPDFGPVHSVPLEG